MLIKKKLHSIVFYTRIILVSEYLNQWYPNDVLHHLLKYKNPIDAALEKKTVFFRFVELVGT